MVRTAIALLKGQRLRLLLTIAGVALCSVLMLFLVSVYRGVSEGSMEYLRVNRTDLWIVQKDSWNIFRCMSILMRGHGELARQQESVESVTPILLLLPGIKANDTDASIFLAGYEPGKLGGPPRITEGRSVETNDEIVLDRAFAFKYGVNANDTVYIHGQPLRVVGLSDGTNAFVIQYAFVTLERAQEIAGVGGIVSAYLVRLRTGVSATDIAATLREEIPGTDVYLYESFLENNRREMESGFLPLLWTIAAIGAVVLGALLSVLMSMHVIERRKDYAVLKTLGAPSGYLPRMLLFQSVAIVCAGCVAGIMLFIPLAYVVPLLTPELTPVWSVRELALVVGSALIVGIVSSSVPTARLRRIYALEAFQ